jgi:hypothetical protein
MTAIRNFPNAPLSQRTRQPLRLPGLPGFAVGVWRALERIGQRRAAWELAVQADRLALSNPVLARQLRETAAECRRAARQQSVQARGSES